MLARHRHHHRGLHGHKHIDRQRRVAMVLVITGTTQATAWGLVLVLGLLHVPFASQLLNSVRFISEISLWALVLACWAQVAASLAQLTAGDAHHDAEVARQETAIDVGQIEEDVARLAALHPGPNAKQLSDSICQRIRVTP